MIKRAQILHGLLAAALTMAAACISIPTDPMLQDLQNDAADMAGFSINGTGSVGVELALGPLSAGVGLTQPGIGYQYASTDVSIETATVGVGWGCGPLLFHRERYGQTLDSQGDESVPSRQYYLRKKLSCPAEHPEFAEYQWGRIRMSLGLLLFGISVELNWLESVDFAGNLLGFDPGDDDAATYYENFASEQADAADEPQTSAP